MKINKKHLKDSGNKTLIYAKKVVSKAKSNTEKILFAIIAFVSIAIIASAFQTRQAQVKMEKQHSNDTKTLQEKIQENFETNTVYEIRSVQEKINSDAWKQYQTNQYGFKIKYPENWKKPTPRASAKGSAAEYEYEFRKPASNTDVYAGFDVRIYSTNGTDVLSDTDELPLRKSNKPECETINDHLLETGDYSAEQIYVPAEDECYDPTMFFSVTQGQYTYNIVPVLKDDKEFTGDPLKEISNDMPEFFVAISTFENIDIIKSKPKPKIIPQKKIEPEKPKFKERKPSVFKKDSKGRRVCNKKDDKPGKSKQGKKKHLDLECCLDPDEYPNPHCYYDPKKYGKYLKKNKK